MEGRTIQETEPAQMNNAFNEIKKNFNKHETKTYQWRVDTLKHLRALTLEMRPQIEEALVKDLKMNKHTAYLSNIAILTSAIDFCLNNLKEW